MKFVSVAKVAMANHADQVATLPVLTYLFLSIKVHSA
jgi:hypothetical protein